MQVVRYSRSRLVKMALLSALLTAGCLWVLLSPETFETTRGRRAGAVRLLANYPLVTAIGAIFFAAGSWRMFLIAAGDLTAMAVTEQGLEVRTVLRRCRVSWRQLNGVEVTPASFFTSGQSFLTARVVGLIGIGIKKLRISTTLLDPDPGAMAAFLAAADQARRAGAAGASVSTATAAPRVASSARAVEADKPMDYDAIIARHLAARAASGEAGASPAPGMPQPARPAFGRKGL